MIFLFVFATMLNMKPRSKYFLGLTLLLVGLFVFCCFSIIFCVLNFAKMPAEKATENYMAFGYLFIHMIAVAIVFYFALKSYMIKDQILSVIMREENDQRNEGAFKKALVFAIIFGILGIFFFLNAFGIINVMSFFSLGLNLALTNVFLSVSSVSLYIYFYKVEPEHIEDVE